MDLLALLHHREVSVAEADHIFDETIDALHAGTSPPEWWDTLGFSQHEATSPSTISSSGGGSSRARMARPACDTAVVWRGGQRSTAGSGPPAPYRRSGVARPLTAWARAAASPIRIRGQPRAVASGCTSGPMGDRITRGIRQIRGNG